MCSTGYLRMDDEQNESMELLPVGSVHSHRQFQRRAAACFSDVIVRKEKA